jgi:hypothetical protein
MGLDLAADQVNAMGGLLVAGKKYTVRVISMDDQFPDGPDGEQTPSGSSTRKGPR